MSPAITSFIRQALQPKVHFPQQGANIEVMICLQSAALDFSAYGPVSETDVEITSSTV